MDPPVPTVTSFNMWKESELEYSQLHSMHFTDPGLSLSALSNFGKSEVVLNQKVLENWVGGPGL